ncbi:unnamed protein product, partial [Allacma fusca]
MVQPPPDSWIGLLRRFCHFATSLFSGLMQMNEDTWLQKEREGLKGVILVIDGTHFPLSEAPRITPWNYFDKDKNYSIQAQIICDSKKRIRSFFTGYLGSVHDSRVYRESHIGRNIQLYLDENQNCRDGEEFGFLEEDMRRFNTFYSSKRVVIEHVNGILKEKFPVLKRIPMPIINDESHAKVCRLIEACAVIYNATLAETTYDHVNPPPMAAREDFDALPEN